MRRVYDRKKAVSILLIAVLVAVCSVVGRNPADRNVTDSAMHPPSVPSPQGSDVDSMEKDVPEEFETATQSGEGGNPVLSENQVSRGVGTDMEFSAEVEPQQEMARENAPSLPESTPATPTTEEFVVAGDTKAVPGNDGMYAVNITVGNEIFTARFYDNESARVLMEQMPMTLDMRDYAGQEKVLALDYDFPFAATQTPSTIRSGDLYLYSGSSLVLFYTTFSNSYRYVPIGYIEDTTGLASALGDGNVLVAFSTP